MKICNSRKKKALILTKLPLYKLGGIEKIAQNIVDLLEEYNWDVDSKSGHDLLLDSKLNTLQKLDDNIFDYIAPMLQLNWKEYDLVITNNFMGAALYTTKQTKIITIIHGLFTPPVKQMAKEFSGTIENFKHELMLEDMIYRNKNQLIAVSKQVQTELANYFDLPSMLVNNGFDFTSYGNKNDFIRKQYNIPSNAIVAIYAGRWDLLQKRPDITLELSKKFLDVIWIFAIDKDIPELEKMENVIVVKNTPYNEMPALYASADFAIQLSSYEGFSNFAMESIASKIPIISTRTGVIDDVYSGTELEDLLIEQSFDREIIKERAIEKVKLLLIKLQIYRNAIETLYPLTKDKFSLQHWKINMAEALDII